ncbi:hypothetical protein Ccrd_017127 [Cynara cardunculus var. scolymus]|uniref:Uncharacterized protein n=1 Tax=Cynara cardunculus var. scolymus TaxID=59895 RepID=A0A103Y8N2_CYNCS|nr:hypothetical protein Ccrd_017127 [Cynara cardunculus var. scolymus]
MKAFHLLLFDGSLIFPEYYDGLEENADMEDGQMPFQEQQSDENTEYPTKDNQMPSEECTSQGSRKRKS